MGGPSEGVSCDECLNPGCDIKKSMESIKHKLGKEYRRDSTITIEKAVNEILADLDVSFLSLSIKQVKQRTSVIERAIRELGLYDLKEQKVSEYLTQEYLSK